MVRLYCVLIGIVFGWFQTAYILSKKHGFDIRTYGSHNSGMTNMLRTMGTKAGITVLVGDMLKVILAMLLTTALFGKSNPDKIYLLKMYTTLGCIIGHNYPFYMRFKGGKGVAVTAGFLFTFRLSFLPTTLLGFLIPYFATKYISLGSLTMVTVFYVQLIIEGQLGMFAPASAAVLAEMYVIGAVITGLCWFQHRGNINRLVHGCERKTYLGKKNHPTLSGEDLKKFEEEKEQSKNASRSNHDGQV